VNGQAVTDKEHLRQDIVGSKPGDVVALAVERHGVMQYVAFEME
jgi:serine protease Do